MLDRIISKKNDYCFLIVLSIFIGIIAELYIEARNSFISGKYIGMLINEYSLEIVLRIILFIAVSFCILFIIYRLRKYFVYIDRYRYLIGALIIVVWTILALSGSSIAMWENNLGGDLASETNLLDSGVLFGIPRQIRSDEWRVFTPFNFSQKYNDYRAVTNIIRGTATDVTTTYGNPCFAIVTLFRPFLWGFFVLDNARGLSFYWISRTVFLFLASYEFGKLISNNQKYVSVLFAGLITFSQTIQWWYSVNGLVEMFLFGQFAIVLLDKLVHINNKYLRLLIALGLVECAGGFLFAYYPAQEIPLAYVFLFVFLWVVLKNRTDIRTCNVVTVILSALIFAIIAGYVLYSAKDTFEVVMNTVYPGERLETGGTGHYQFLFTYIISLLSPIDEGRITGMVNASELACFYSLFPLGTIWSLYYLIRKKKDLLLILLLIVNSYFLLFFFVGFPTILAKLTLMSSVTLNRLVVIIEYVEIMMLIRCISNYSNEEYGQEISIARKIIRFALIGVVCLAEMIMVRRFGLTSSKSVWLVAAGVFIVFLTYLFVIGSNAINKASVFLFVIVSIMGMLVNPLQKGTGVIYDNPVTKMVERVVHSDKDAIWMVTPGGAISNLPIMVGAKTINCTNIYPNNALWSEIDDDSKYIDVYNRYAHISMNITDEETTFELTSPDAFTVNINEKDIKKIGVKYILSKENYNSSMMKLIANANGYKIYKVSE